MKEQMEQVMIRASAEDVAAIDALARADGYETRSAWIRKNLRQVINERKYELTTVTVLPHSDGEQVVPVVTVSKVVNS